MRRCLKFGARRGVSTRPVTGAFAIPAAASHRKRSGLLALLVAIACLAGCSTLPGNLPAGSLSAGFELLGRAAIRHGQEAASVSVQWRHQAASDDMLITNSMGQGVARISRADGEVLLETSDGRRFKATDAESLTDRILGWRIPLSGLPDWLRARAAPSPEAHSTLGANGRLVRLEQDAWQIEYQEYRGERPVRMRLSRPNLEIRLIVDSWREAEP
ncbi:MAG: outer membrane lipoprotein LolB [Betaproteobacteria bacterium]|nr:outer membrane lipoprotein LolB [Betaproteobacteria bacterium]